MKLVQYYLVDHSLKLRRGKVCSQVGHGAILSERMFQKMRYFSNSESYLKTSAYEEWFRNHDQTKIVLKASTEDLQRAMAEFKDAIEVIDAGKTEIAEGTRTVVVLPVIYKDMAPDWVKELPLL
jgi:peptidyl-tRNA hydrolase